MEVELCFQTHHHQVGDTEGLYELVVAFCLAEEAEGGQSILRPRLIKSAVTLSSICSSLFKVLPT